MSTSGGSAAPPPATKGTAAHVTTTNVTDEKARSQGLVQIVTVVYGVALTAVLVVGVKGHPSALIRPQIHWRNSVILLAACLFSVYGYFSYVMSLASSQFAYRTSKLEEIEGKKRRLNEWVRLWNLGRFGADLILAVLYVRVLLLATVVGRSNVHNLLVAMGMVYGWVVVVRLVRYGLHRQIVRNVPSAVALPYSVASFWLAHTSHPPLHLSTYTHLCFIILGAVVVYMVLTDLVAKCARDWAEEVPEGRRTLRCWRRAGTVAPS